MTTEINNIPDINKYEIEGLERKTNVSALALGIVACVVGIALFIIQKMSANTLLAYAMIFVGIVMVCYGAFQIIWQSKKWFYTPTNSVTCCHDYYYGADDFASLKQSLENKNLNGIKQMKAQCDGNVRMRVIRSKDNQFAAAQVFRYVPFEFHPESKIMVMKDADAKAFVALF